MGPPCVRQYYRACLCDVATGEAKYWTVLVKNLTKSSLFVGLLIFERAEMLGNVKVRT